MASEVIGQIVGPDGTKDVFLNNAATEATLRALLAATAKTPEAIRAAMELAAKAGLDPRTVAQVDEGLTALSTNSKTAAQATEEAKVAAIKLQDNFRMLFAETAKLTDGTASLHGIFSSMSRVLPGKIGIVIDSMTALAAFQEKSLAAYRELTSVGANFSGSLTDMRMAAANSYLTLDQFTTIVKSNSATLAKMGGTVDDGVRAFATLNKSLITSPAGDQLMALGYTAADVSNGMLSFINITGGRTKSELANTGDIVNATKDYLVELDKLTQFSGTSRKEQEELQKKAATSGAYQLALSNMTEEQKARTAVGLAAAQTRGAGATDLFMAKIAGLPAAMTADGRKFQGMFGGAANGIIQMADAARSTSGTMQDVESGYANANAGLVSGVRSLGMSATAIGMTGDTVMNKALLDSVQLKKIGGDTAAGTTALMAEITANQKKQTQSQAENAIAVERSLKDLGASLTTAASTIYSIFMPVINFLGQHLLITAGLFGGLAVGLTLLKTSIGTIGAFAAGGKFGAGSKMEGLVKVFGDYGHSFVKPLFVHVVNMGGGLGGLSEPNIPTGGPKESNKGFSVGRSLKLGAGGLAAGLAGSYASESGYTKTGAALDIAGTAFDYAAIAGPIAEGLAATGVGLPAAALVEGVAAFVGAGVGIFKNWDTLFGDSKEDKAKKAAKTVAEQIAADTLEQTKLQNRLLDRQIEQSDRQHAEYMGKKSNVVVNGYSLASNGTGNSFYRDPVPPAAHI